MIIYFILSRCKLEQIVGELLQKAAEDATGKEVRQKHHALRNILLTIDEVLAHNEAKKKIFLHMCSSNIAAEFVINGLKKQRTRVFKVTRDFR